MVMAEPSVSWPTGLLEAHLDLASRLENHLGSPQLTVQSHTRRFIPRA